MAPRPLAIGGEAGALAAVARRRLLFPLNTGYWPPGAIVEERYSAAKHRLTAKSLPADHVRRDAAARSRSTPEALCTSGAYFQRPYDEVPAHGPAVRDVGARSLSLIYRRSTPPIRGGYLSKPATRAMWPAKEYRL